MTTGVWYSIPKKIKVNRKEGEFDAVRIEEGYASSDRNILGLGGGLTLPEVEDLLWACKQAVSLLKTGHLIRQKI